MSLRAKSRYTYEWFTTNPYEKEIIIDTRKLANQIALAAEHNNCSISEICIKLGRSGLYSWYKDLQMKAQLREMPEEIIRRAQYYWKIAPETYVYKVNFIKGSNGKYKRLALKDAIDTLHVDTIYINAYGISNAIRAKAKSENMSLADFLAKHHTSLFTIEDWLSRTNPAQAEILADKKSSKAFYKYCEILDVDPCYFISGENKPETTFI